MPKTQLTILANSVPEKEAKYNLSDCICYLKYLSEGHKALLSEV